MRLSFSTLRLLSQCAYAHELKQRGVPEAPSEALQVGKEFHAAVAATLRGEDFVFTLPEAEEYYSVIEPFLYTLAPLPAHQVEVRLEFEVEGAPWLGFVDAVAEGYVYEFKTAKRMPSKLDFPVHLQASIYASRLQLAGAKVVYVTKKAHKVFDVPPLPDVDRFLQLITQRFSPHQTALPTGLFHPWACTSCGFSHACEFYAYVRATGALAEDEF